MNRIFDIKVVEKPIVVKDTIDNSWKTVPEFNIIVKTIDSTLYLNRYIPDLYSFDQLVKTHYQKIKIPFPALTETISKIEKRKSFRNFFHISSKSNAEKVEKYLYRCSCDPIIKSSSLLRDFFSPQREGDSLEDRTGSIHVCSSLSPDNLLPSSNPSIQSGDHMEIESSNLSVEIPITTWVPSPNISTTSLPLSNIIDQLDNKSQMSNKSNRSYHGSNRSYLGSNKSYPGSNRSYPGSNRSYRSNKSHRSYKANLSQINHGYPDHTSDNSDLIDNTHEDEESDENFFDLLSRSRENNQSTSSIYFPLDHLEMVKVLGKGCMGKVMLVRSRKTNEYYALKSIIKEHVIEQREIAHTLDEKNILSQISEINHPFLAKLHASFQDEHRLYLLTNYYCGGDLATHMAKLYNFPPECALFYAAEMIAGIGELHRLGILYRDLKPENILLSGDGHIVLTDFGLSKWLDEANDYSTQTFCGTAEYLAPEVLLGEPYSFGIDHWSFGTILYEMLAGVTPFWADNHPDMYRRVLEDPLEFPADIFDYETAEFLSDILDRDPCTRLGVNGVDEIKQHVYFADIDWVGLEQRQVMPPPYLPSVAHPLDFTNFDPDFLALSPKLTPVPSEFEFPQDFQDVFDRYSFVDPDYRDSEYPQPEIYHRQAHQDGFYPLTTDDEMSIHSPSIPPARKRGSISMLSNVDSFQVEDESFNNRFVPPSIEAGEIKDEEFARYAKRRNTAAPEDHTLVDVPQATLVVMDIKQDDTLLSVSSLDEFSKLPDLRLSFHMDMKENQKAPASTKSTRTNGSKTRRFFTALLS